MTGEPLITGANRIRPVNGKKLCPDCIERSNRFEG